VAPGIADNYPARWEQPAIDFHPQEVGRILGVSVDPQMVREILARLEFEIEPAGGGWLDVRVPSHRGDVGLQADLVEEVARVWGYENIPTTMMSSALPPQRPNMDLHWEKRAREVLVACGLQEVITYSLIDDSALRRMVAGPAEPGAGLLYPASGIAMANPLTPEQSALRLSLIPSLLWTVAANLRHEPVVEVFEIARIYLPRESDLPQERRLVALALAGSDEKLSWLAPGYARDLYDLKGVIGALLDRLGVRDFGVAPTSHPSFRPGRAADLMVAGERAGVLGELHPDVAEAFQISRETVAVAELDFEVIASRATMRRAYRPLPRFPGVAQDLAIVVDDSIPAAQVGALIREAGGDLLEDARLFDVYAGEPIASGKRSLAYSLTFRSPERTLTDQEAQKAQERIQRALEERLGAELRG